MSECLSIGNSRSVPAPALSQVQFDVVAHEQVKEAVAVVINPGAAGAPANTVFPQSCLLGHIRKRAVAVVMPQDIMTPVAAEQVIPAIIVVVPDTNTRAPSGAAQTGFFRHIRKRAVTIILKQVLRGCRPTRIRFLPGKRSPLVR